jgi:hypothetical protein
MSTPDEVATQRVRLRAAGVCLRSDRVLGDDQLAGLVVDDLCWEIALADWSRREPRRWQRRRRASWRAEESALWAERGRIRTLAQRYGLPII